jgi:hypothetical protein
VEPIGREEYARLENRMRDVEQEQATIAEWRRAQMEEHRENRRLMFGILFAALASLGTGIWSLIK